jgi:PTS system N-acetylglucosamine-specific IIC component
VVHAVLTGLSMVIMNALGVKLGFGFSAGLIDYGMNYGLSTRAWLLLPVGGVYFAIYYFSFRFFILKFDLKTPGRDVAPEVTGTAPADESDRAQGFIQALGGAANLTSVEACTTRLRLVLADQAAIDEPRLRALGARGILRLGEHDMQIVLGPIADAVAEEIRARLRGGGAAPAPALEDLAAALRRALAPASPRRIEARSARLIVDLDHPDRLDLAALEQLGLRGVTRAAPSTLHILAGGDAGALAQLLDR